MKTKLEMAHEYALQLSKNPSVTATHNDKDIASRAWGYADAMQVEADKREKEEAAQRRKEIREMLNAPNTFVEREGQHFDDVEEWQPDWSQAPDDACCWFIGGSSWDLKAYWSKYIPCYKSETTQTTWQGNGMIEAPSFGYTGDWRESLRKRPK